MDGRYGDIFDTMRRMQLDGKPIDPTTVGGELPAHAVFLWSVTDEVPSTSNTLFHAQMVHEAAVRRRVAEAGTRIHSWAGDLDLADLADKARKEVDDALGMQKRKVRFMQDTIGDTIAAIGKPSKSVPSPWRSLNETIGGFRPGGLYVIGARPGVGKTAVSMQAALELSKHGVVAYSSLEMPEHELHLRAISAGAWVPHALLEAPHPLPDWARKRVAEWKAATPKMIAFDDRGSVTVNDIRAHARSVSREGHLAGVVVDYLQLISGASGSKRLEVVTEASRQLKLLARDLECPVIALSQLNRNSESRMDKRPALSDLRESGAIEQDADLVVLLHRDMEPRPEQVNEFDMLVAKNRHGQTRALSMEWHGEFMSVLDR
jgi:replicative DNA helicase